MSVEKFPTTDYDSDIAAIQRNPEMGNRNDPIKELATVVVAQPVYTMLGTESAAETVLLCRVPKRYKLLEDLSNVANDGMATTATIDVGTSTTADRYADGLDTAAAGRDAFGVTGDDTVDNSVESDEADSYVILTFATLATPVAGKKVKVNLYFAVDS